MDAPEDDSSPITRGAQPLDTPADAEGVTEAEQAREDELDQQREQIGTTRGGQPIENVKHGDENDSSGD